MSVRFRPPAPTPCLPALTDSPLSPSRRRNTEEILAPCGRRVVNGKPCLKAKQPARPSRSFNKTKSRFLGSLAALLSVTRPATRHAVRPFCSTAPRSRHHMVAGEFSRGQQFCAVLAAVLVPGVDVVAGELDVPPPETHEPDEPNDGGNAHRRPGRVDLLVGLLEHLDLIEKHELQRTLPVDHVQGLERRIQYEDVFEDSHLLVIERVSNTEFLSHYIANRSGLQRPGQRPLPTLSRGQKKGVAFGAEFANYRER